MQDYEVNPCINKFFPLISSFKIYSNGYFRKQQNETGHFCGMTLINFRHPSAGLLCLLTWAMAMLPCLPCLFLFDEKLIDDKNMCVSK